MTTYTEMLDAGDLFDWEGRCLCEVPERPPGYGAYVCGRAACQVALAVGAAHDPGLTIGIKWGMGSRTTILASTFVMLLDGRSNDITPVAEALGRNYDSFDETIDGETFTHVQYVRDMFITHDPKRDGSWD